MRALSKSTVLALGVLLLWGCGSDSNGPTRGTQLKTLQALHIVGGVGSAAYFQLLWPQVEFALADRDIYSVPPTEAFATLEPSSEGHHFAADRVSHEWFATSKAPWIHADGTPYEGMELTGYLVSLNQTHTREPTTTVLQSGFGLIPASSRYQISKRHTPHPVVMIRPEQFYGAAPDAPVPAIVDDAAAMAALYAESDGPDLTPTDEELSLFGIGELSALSDDQLSPEQRAALSEFGRQLIVAAKALRSDQSMTIMLPFAMGDPHSAFAEEELPRTENIAKALQMLLNGFYDLLAEAERDGDVVITFSGDTMKNPSQPLGWPDGTPAASNAIYVVGKGHLRHGWFGRVRADGVAVGFDPASGSDLETPPTNLHQQLAMAAVAYAITVRDFEAVEGEGFRAGALEEYRGLVR